ncbi:Multiple epidermal growth factor-like domains protein 8 [Hypsibius exemplaris]|uniref:Multiple epidermal growth factor-like domains protein 8 n=1 Tax=Hypsibius exemplaris TaxID=2072580 RepID=A0A1W0WQ53_HYPEX|nr:Multiple epidermal growth factor-like domains protein 8 [Hypsibius exemplaris]
MVLNPATFLLPWSFTILLYLLPSASCNSSSPPEIISECKQNGSSRHVIDQDAAGSLLFRPGYGKNAVRGGVPCQWFIDGSANGTHVLLNVSHLAGDCGFHACIFVMDGDSLEDPLLAALPGSIGRDGMVVVSSTPKLFIHIAAGCEGLVAFYAGFRVLNCSLCSSNCSATAAAIVGEPSAVGLRAGCDSDCPMTCEKVAQAAAGGCSASDPNSVSKASGLDCASGEVQAEVTRLWSTLSSSGLARAGHTSVFFNQTIWSFGGYDSSKAVDRFDGYLVNTGLWSPGESISEMVPSARYLHTAVLINDTIFIYGGFDAAGAVLNEFWSYNFTTKIWTVLGNNFVPGLAAHSATLIGQEIYILAAGLSSGRRDREYMSFPGYNLQSDSRSCRRSGVYFFHLNCLAFLGSDVFEDKNLTIPELSRFGHSIVSSDDRLYIYGGISDTLSHDLSSLTLPDFIASNGDHCVKDYTKRATCQADISCVWCPKSSDSDLEEGLCVGTQSARIICGAAAVNPTCTGLCPALTSCTSCLGYRQESHCTWCPLSAKCVASTTNSRDDCSVKKASTKDVMGWWISKPVGSLETIEQCQKPQTSSGLTFLVYQPTPDLTMPDEMNTITSSVLIFNPKVRFPPKQETGMLILEMKGFIHPMGANPKSTWETHLRMWVRAENSLGFEGVVQLWLSTDADPKNAALVAESKSIFPIKTEANRHDDLLFPSVDDKYFVKFVYQVTVTRSRLQSAEFEIRLHLTWNGNSIVPQALDTRNLEPFSTSGISCPTYNNCLRCLTDTSCGWCAATKKCISRSLDNPRCQSPDGTAVLLHLDFIQCTDCAVVQDSLTCNKEKHCLWDVPARLCLRSSLVPLERSISVQPDCTKRTSCSNCVHSLENCIWCHSTNQCLPRSAFNVALAFGQCRFWENSNVAGPARNAVRSKNARDAWPVHTAAGARRRPRIPGKERASLAIRTAPWTAIRQCVRLMKSLDITPMRRSHTCGPSSPVQTSTSALSVCMIAISMPPALTLGDIFSVNALKVKVFIYKGDGRTSCVKTCDHACVNGHCSDEDMPLLEPFKCICDLGWTGAKCDVDCGCNFHSDCSKNVTQCDQCYGNTEGQFCERCVKGTFGNATTDKACTPCLCNGHADPSQPCESATGKCNCDYPYQGTNCEKCPADYFGDPTNGGLCYSRCRSRTVIVNATSGGLGDIGDTGDSFCLWILIAGQENRFRDKLPITLTISSSSLEAACPNNSIIITDGFPAFLVQPDISTDISVEDAKLFDLWENAGRKSKTLGKICGPLEGPTSLTAKSGILTVMMWKSSRLERFNATYRLDEGALDARKKRAPQSGQVSSRIGYSAGVVGEDTVYLFGGLDPLDGVMGDVWWTRRKQADVPVSVATAEWTKLDVTDASRWRWPLPRYFHASCVVEAGIVIHGGFVQNADRMQIGNDVWLFNATTRTWMELPFLNTPRLAGHTMTVVKDTVYVIGGADNSFSDAVYTFKITEWQWRVFPANGSRPPGVYGHSATYYPIRNAIFVFGGYRFDLDRTGMSSVMSVLDLNRRRWVMMPNMRQDLFSIATPRMFHAAQYVNAGRYMLVAGGRTRSELFSRSVVVYRFRCNSWLHDNGPTSLYRPAFAYFPDPSDTVIWLLSGFAYSQPHIEISQIPITTDFCPRFATTRSCLSISGCGMCAMESSNGSFCFDNSNGDAVRCGDAQDRGNLIPGLSCDENLSVMRICREQTECRTCVAPWIGVGEDESRCHWCTNCGNGVCIARYESCETSLSCNKSNSVIREPGRCPDEYCHAADCQKCHDMRTPCFWTRSFRRASETQLNIASQRNPAFSWNCFQQGILQVVPHTAESRDTALKAVDCPIPCHRLDSCSDCLASSGASGGFQQCIWSMDSQTCLDPALVHLRCPLGNCGALLYGRSRDRCPRDPRGLSVCRECLKSSQTGWCALDLTNGKGTCLLGGISGPEVGTCSETAAALSNNVTKGHEALTAVAGVDGDVLGKKAKALLATPASHGSSLQQEEVDLRHTWHFLACPPENECLNGHHTCDDKSEECHDTLLGFNCTCKAGYMAIAATAPDRPARCDPICTQGCQNGRCVEPETCECQFGFVGLNCSIACQCNGHSQCPSEHELTTCSQCMNNTYGTHCEKCEEGFVGDARNGGICQSCLSYCNGHSSVCLTLSQYLNISSDAPFLPDNPFQSIESFQQLKLPLDRDGANKMAICRQCDGNTGATDSICDGSDKKELPNGIACWTIQCAKCKEYFIGTPTNFHQCYRQLSVGEDHCFDPELPAGRCVPVLECRHSNYVDVTVGAVDLWFSDKDDQFTVTVDKRTGFHNVEVDPRYLAGARGIDEVVDFHRANGMMTFVSAEDRSKVVIIRDIRNRAVLTIPYGLFDLKTSKFYVVVQSVEGAGAGSPSSHDVAARGRILFKQDQPHIDLFVFFSVFFSCFFLFLAVCIVLWKFKHVYGVRQTRQRVAIELQTMASRPFGSVCLVFERKSHPRAIPVFSMGETVVTPMPSPGAVASTSTGEAVLVSGTRKPTPPKVKKKKRNVVDPQLNHHETASPRSSLLGVDGVPLKVPKLTPMAMEFLQGGAAAVATFPMELPGGPDCPVRFCLASTFVAAPQIYANFNSKSD